MAIRDAEPIIDDQYLAAQVYFACVIGLICLEAISVLPAYIQTRLKHGTFREASVPRFE